MNHDHIGLAFILTTLAAICAYLAWAERRRERDQTVLAFLDETTEDINLDAVNEGRVSLYAAIARVMAADLDAVTTTADLPDDMRSA